MARNKESISERALAVRDAGSVTVAGMTFRTVKNAVVPTLRQKGNAPVVFIVKEKMRLGKQIPGKPGEQPIAPAWLVRVESVQNGRIYDYVVPAILRSVWIDEYDADHEIRDANGNPTGKQHTGENTYVGKAFLVQKGEKPDGKRYREIEAFEIDPSEIIETET